MLNKLSTQQLITDPELYFISIHSSSGRLHLNGQRWIIIGTVVFLWPGNRLCFVSHADSFDKVIYYGKFANSACF